MENYNYIFIFLYAITILNSVPNSCVFVRTIFMCRIAIIIYPDIKMEYGQRYMVIWLFKIFSPLWNALIPPKVQRSLKFESVLLTCIIVQHGARE